MMKRLLTTLAAAMLACGAGYAQKTINIKSPDGLIRMTVRVDRKSLPEYDVFYRGTQLVNGGRMGFVFDSGEFGRGLRTGRIERPAAWSVTTSLRANPRMSRSLTPKP